MFIAIRETGCRRSHTEWLLKEHIMRTISTIRRSSLTAVVAGALPILIASTSDAATLFVGNSGTSTYPSIAAALSAASPNDIIQLSVGFTDTAPFSIGALPVTIRGNPANPGSCVVAPTSTGFASKSTSVLAPSQLISFNGVTLRGANQYAFSGGQLLIVDCLIDVDAGGNAPEFSAVGTALTVRNTTIPDIGVWWNDLTAFTVQGGSVVFDSVDVQYGSRAVLVANGSLATISRSTFQNFWFDFPDAVLRFGGGSVTMTDSRLDAIVGPVGFKAINATTVLTRNTFTNHGGRNWGYPIEISGPACTITNSSFSQNGSYNSAPTVGVVNSPNFLVRNCQFTDNGPTDTGTGALNLHGAGTVRDSSFLRNETWGNGGAVRVLGSNIVFERCQFYDNFGGDADGAVRVEGKARFKNCDFVGNVSTDGFYIDAGGGAVGIWGAGQAKFVRCNFDSNETGGVLSGPDGGSGGAIALNSGTLIVDRCTFVNNVTHFDPFSTPALGSSGGAIAILAGAAQISQSTFIANDAEHHGGAIAVFGGICALDRGCFVSGNSAAPTLGSGGGLYLNGAIGTIQRSYTCGNSPDNRVGPWLIDAWSLAWCP